ncbi:hypothetical protein AB3S75_023000 [Citrus x aurantiifolia]
MAKGKHVVVDVASDQEDYLEDEYDDLFADNANLAYAENEAHFDGAEMDGVNFVPPDIDVPKSSNSRIGVNMRARQNKRLKTKKGKIVVQHNEMGVPACDEATELASFIGVLAGTSVSILYSIWRKGRFIVHPRSRKPVIQSIGIAFWNFKYILAINYILKFRNDKKKLYAPPIEYPQIKHPIWIKFVDQRLSESFEKISRVNKNRRALNKCNHRLSRKGYVGLMKEICAELGLSEELIDMSELWKRAWMLKNGGYDFETEQIIKKMVIKFK